MNLGARRKPGGVGILAHGGTDSDGESSSPNQMREAPGELRGIMQDKRTARGPKSGGGDRQTKKRRPGRAEIRDYSIIERPFQPPIPSASGGHGVVFPGAVKREIMQLVWKLA